MRIAFAGPSGSGKSTLAGWLAHELGYEQCPVGSRSVAAEMGFASPYDVDTAGRRVEFQRRLLQGKREWELERGAFVSDRTTLDNLAYTAMHASRDLDELYLDVAVAGVRRLDHVFLCPADHLWLAGDPCRVPDRAYHRVYEAVLLGLFARLAPDVELVRLDSPDFDERKRVVRERVGF